MKITLLFIFSLQLALVSQNANARFTVAEDSDKILDQKLEQEAGQLSYLDALPKLRLMDRSGDTVAGLNQAYSAVKSSGNSNPTVAQVISEYKKTHTASAASVVKCFGNPGSAGAPQRYDCQQQLSSLIGDTKSAVRQQSASLITPHPIADYGSGDSSFSTN